MPPTTPTCTVERVGIVALCLSLSACGLDDDLDPPDGPHFATPPALADAPVADAVRAVAEPSAILPGFGLTLVASGSDLSLDWAPLGADAYEIWRSHDPYFSPGDEGSTLRATVTEPPWLDPGVACSTCEDVYYVVRADDETSTTAGAHMLTVFDGYNKIPLSLVTPSIASAADLASMAEPGVLGVYLWSASAQGYLGWTGVGDGFDVGLGQAPIAHLTLPPGPQLRVLTGLVPAPEQALSMLEPGDNIVVLPLIQSDMLASDLLDRLPEDTRVGQWRPDTQTVAWYEDPSDDDFSVPSGRDLHVEVTEARPWPAWPGAWLDDEFDGDLSGWSILNGEQAEIEVVDDRLHIVPTVNSPWYNESTGPLVYKTVEGDFIATVDLSARGLADPLAPPPATFRVGGLMARNPDTADENYVFVGLGADFAAEALETKTTVDSISHFVETYWPGAEGELRICRVGARFELLVREPPGPWQSAAVYERPDLPPQLQVGLFAFSANDDPNMQAWVDWARFEVPTSAEDCDP